MKRSVVHARGREGQPTREARFDIWPGCFRTPAAAATRASGSSSGMRRGRVAGPAFTYQSRRGGVLSRTAVARTTRWSRGWKRHEERDRARRERKGGRGGGLGEWREGTRGDGLQEGAAGRSAKGGGREANDPGLRRWRRGALGRAAPPVVTRGGGVSSSVGRRGGGRGKRRRRGRLAASAAGLLDVLALADLQVRLCAGAGRHRRRAHAEERARRERGSARRLGARLGHF